MYGFLYDGVIFQACKRASRPSRKKVTHKEDTSFSYPTEEKTNILT
jgi:hypothetical protein